MRGVTPVCPQHTATAGFRMNLAVSIALSHLFSHRRQTAVSLLGITLGVAFFMAVTSLMQGSDADFIKRLVDSSPHVTVYDEYRDPRPQPVLANLSPAPPSSCAA